MKEELRALKNSCINIGLNLVAIYSLLFGAVPFTAGLFSEKIRSQTQLEQIVNEEKDKLGIANKVVTPKIVERMPSWYSAGRCKSEGGDNYSLNLVKGISNNRLAVRHELYHIKYHNLKDKSWAKYFLCCEPAAVIYSLTGSVSD